MPRKIARRYLRNETARQRKPKLKHRPARLTIRGARAPAMELRDSFDDGQSQARVAAAFAVTAALKEALKYVCEHRCVDARSAVCDSDGNTVVA